MSPHIVPQPESSAGAKIKTYREAKGWNQKELAERADVSPSTISGAENGRFTPSPDILQRIADALGVPFYEFVDSDTGSNVKADTLLDILRIYSHRREFLLAYPLIKQLQERGNLLDYQRQALNLHEADYLIHIEQIGQAIEKLSALAYEVEVTRTHAADPHFLATVQNKLGTAWYLKNDFVTALHHYKRALEILTSHAQPADPLLGKIYYNLGNTARWMRNDNEAVEYLKRSVETLQSFCNPRLSANAYFVLGIAHKNQGDLRSAGAAFTRALVHYEQADIKKWAQLAKSEIAYFVNQSPQEALLIMEEELAVLQDSYTAKEKGLTYARMTNLYLELNDLPSAERSIAQALHLTELEPLSGEYGFALRLYAKVLLQKGEYEQASEYAIHSSDVLGQLGLGLEMKESLELAKEAILLFKDFLQKK